MTGTDSSAQHGFHLFDEARLAPTPWRNGGGETREVAGRPTAGGLFAWRVSIATIAQDGPFSVFPDVDRTITLIAGNGVHLHGDTLDHDLGRPAEPFAFPGDAAVHATLTDGPTRNFNVMTQRGTWTATVRAATAAVHPPAAHAGAFYVLRGRWRTTVPLSPGQGLWWHTPADVPPTPGTDDALALWADIRPVTR